MKSHHKNPRLDAFEMLPPEARVIVQDVFEFAMSRAMPQTKAYRLLQQRLADIGIPSDDVALPSFSSFNRFILRKRGVPAGKTAKRTPDAMSFSDQTRRLLSAGLRSLADDLERNIPLNEALAELVAEYSQLSDAFSQMKKVSQVRVERDTIDPLIDEAKEIAILQQGAGGMWIYVPGYGQVYVPLKRGS